MIENVMLHIDIVLFAVVAVTLSSIGILGLCTIIEGVDRILHRWWLDQ